MINIVRDPRWGSVTAETCRHARHRHSLTPAVAHCPDPHRRNIESAGEDPFLSGQYASNWVQGFQTARETPYPLQAAAW